MCTNLSNLQRPYSPLLHEQRAGAKVINFLCKPSNEFLLRIVIICIIFFLLGKRTDDTGFNPQKMSRFIHRSFSMGFAVLFFFNPVTRSYELSNMVQNFQPKLFIAFYKHLINIRMIFNMSEWVIELQM